MKKCINHLFCINLSYYYYFVLCTSADSVSLLSSVYIQATPTGINRYGLCVFIIVNISQFHFGMLHRKSRQVGGRCEASGTNPDLRSVLHVGCLSPGYGSTWMDERMRGCDWSRHADPSRTTVLSTCHYCCSDSQAHEHRWAQCVRLLPDLELISHYFFLKRRLAPWMLLFIRSYSGSSWT